HAWVEQRRDDGDRHSHCRDAIAAHGGSGAREAAQPLDEECEGDDVHDVEEAAELQEGGGEQRAHHATPSPPSSCPPSPCSMSIRLVGASPSPAWVPARCAGADPAGFAAPSSSPAP